MMAQVEKPTQCLEDGPTPQTVYLGEVPINISAVSEVTGIDVGYLSRILAGRQRPSIGKAEKIAHALGVGLDSLLRLIQARALLLPPVKSRG